MADAAEIESARQAIIAIGRRKEAGEISEDEFREQVMPHARLIAEAQEAGAAKVVEVAGRLLAMAEANPAAVEAIAAGLAAGVVKGLGVWLRGVTQNSARQE